MSHRYFVEASIRQEEKAVLSGPEAHHLLHVMRAKPGDELVLFDGSGEEFPARIEALRRSEVEVAILGRRAVDRELPCPVTLGVALPKGDRQRWLIEKAVELGITRLVPLETARSVAQPGGKAINRLTRAVIEASKQCGRNRLMEVAPAQPWSEFVGSQAEACTRFIAHPSPDGVCLNFTDLPFGHVAVAVGPEGGFADEEVDQARDLGWQTVALGARILRIETAASVLAALVGMALENHKP